MPIGGNGIPIPRMISALYGASKSHLVNLYILSPHPVKIVAQITSTITIPNNPNFVNRSSPIVFPFLKMERILRFELRLYGWKPHVLPLNTIHAKIGLLCLIGSRSNRLHSINKYSELDSNQRYPACKTGALASKLPELNKCVQKDSNLRPVGYQPTALTN